jgi:hypothetical protein
MIGRHRLLVPALLTFPLAVPAGAAAASTTYAPKCVKAGGESVVTVQHSETSTQSRQQGETILVPQVLKNGSPTLLPEASSAIKAGFAPYSYVPSTALPGTLIPTFTQTLRIPAATSYGGNPLLGYSTRVEAYDATGTTRYGFDRTDGYLQIDLLRILSAGKVRAGQTLPIYVTGFRTKPYVHVVSPSGKRLRTVRMPTGASTNLSCGQAYSQISFSGAKPGNWRLVANTKKTSTSAAGGVAVKVRVTR